MANFKRPDRFRLFSQVLIRKNILLISNLLYQSNSDFIPHAIFQKKKKKNHDFVTVSNLIISATSTPMEVFPNFLLPPCLLENHSFICSNCLHTSKQQRDFARKWNALFLISLSFVNCFFLILHQQSQSGYEQTYSIFVKR